MVPAIRAYRVFVQRADLIERRSGEERGEGIESQILSEAAQKLLADYTAMSEDDLSTIIAANFECSFKDKAESLLAQGGEFSLDSVLGLFSAMLDSLVAVVDELLFASVIDQLVEAVISFNISLP